MKIKKRVIALVVGLVAVLLFSFIYVVAAGRHYTLHTNVYYGEDVLKQTEVVVGDETVVKSEKIYLEDGELIAEFDAVGAGETTVRLVTNNTQGDEMLSPEYFFEVNALGTIVDRTYGRIVFSGYRAVIYAMIAQLLMTEVIMLWLYVDHRRKGDFSYSMIACGGLSIYVGLLIAYVVYYLLNNFMNSFSFFLMLVTNAGMILLLALIPLMLLLSVLLAVSNVWLMRHEGYRPVNALGIVFAVLWFSGTLLTIGHSFFPIVWGASVYNLIILPLIYVVGYMECMFISTVMCSFLATRYRIPYDRDYIIILGCAIRGDGSLTPLLQGRVDSAVAFEKKQFEATGKHAVFVPSGGQGSDEVISEGKAMENYLLSIGIPAEQIAREDKSVNTLQNMQFSKQVIDRHAGGKESRIAFATTNYHVFRGYILVKKLGFAAKGIAAKTKQYFFPNAFLREFIGLLVDQKWKHLLFIALTVLFFMALNLIQ